MQPRTTASHVVLKNYTTEKTLTTQTNQTVYTVTNSPNTNSINEPHEQIGKR